MPAINAYSELLLDKDVHITTILTKDLVSTC